jgi:hypothetical protein
MTGTGTEGLGLGGTLRLTWVTDHLAHVLEHVEVDEASGTWTGLACPDHDLQIGTDVDNATPSGPGPDRRPGLGRTSRVHRRARPTRHGGAPSPPIVARHSR